MKLIELTALTQAAIVAYYSAVGDHTERPLLAGMTEEEKTNLEREIARHLVDPELGAEQAHARRGLAAIWDDLHGEHRIRQHLIKALADAGGPMLDPEERPAGAPPDGEVQPAPAQEAPQVEAPPAEPPAPEAPPAAPMAVPPGTEPA